MPSPRVSVVIPCHNAAPFLEECVESVLAQTRTDLEIVVVDDASTDGSLELAHALAERHPQVRVIAEHARRSSIARNTGIEHARGELIVNLDADDLLDPRFVELTAAALEAHPEAAVAYGTWKAFGESAGSSVAKPWDLHRLLRGNYIAANSTFRRSAWESVGGFATDIRYEDWDLWLRFGEAGYTGVPVPGAIFHYRRRAAGQNVQNAPRNERIRAEFVHRRPHLYDAREREWAQAVREAAGEPAQPLPGGGPLPPAEHRPGAEPAVPRRAIAFVAVPEGREIPEDVLAELAAGGVEARALTPQAAGEGDPTGRAERLAAEAGADWLLALNPGERCASPWPDLTLTEAISFADSLGYDAMAGGNRIVAWRPGAGERTVCPVPLLLGPDEERVEVLGRASRDLLLSAAVRGGPAATQPDPAALGRWGARALGLDRPVPADLLQAATSAVNAGADLAALDARELQVMLIAARLREAELRVRNRPHTASRDPRQAIEDAIGAVNAAASMLLDVRGFATAVHADEAADLVRAYARAFGEGDDVTLVIYDDLGDPDGLAERLAPLVAEARLDAPGAPDVLGISVPRDGERLLAAGVHAVLARRTPSGALADLPRFDDASALRELAAP